jgi:F-type H+-transporting ATPase subunit b
MSWLPDNLHMEVLTNFGIQPTLLLAQIVNFLIIFFLLKKFFYGKITKALEDRKQKIAESLQNADLIEQKLQQTEQKMAAILQEARENAKTVISDAKGEAQRIIDESILEARKTQEDAIISAKTQIEAQKDEMRKSLEKETLVLVTEVVKKVLGRNLKQKEQQELTAQAVSEIGKQIQ